jgi:hypothetical protein
MTQTASVYGVRETLKALGEIEPALKRELQKGMRDATRPMQTAVGAALPAAAPLSGMSRGRLAWSSKDRKASAKTGGKRRSDGTFPLVAVVVKSGGAVLADMAATGTLGANLSAAVGRNPSRFVWPAASAAMPAVERAVIDTIRQASERLGEPFRQLPRGG